jgi:hypothetical protein
MKAGGRVSGWRGLLLSLAGAAAVAGLLGMHHLSIDGGHPGLHGQSTVLGQPSPGHGSGSPHPADEGQ